MRNIPFHYRGWSLYSREATTPEGVPATIYFFERGKSRAGKPVDTLPEGATVVWDEAGRRPVLERGYKGYRLTEREYIAMSERQGGRCAICGRTPDEGGLVIDHEHGSGKVRGLLCGPCNRGLGMFGDEAARLKAAVEYLEQNSRQTR